MDMLSIGQVARRAGIGVETVRFYEREGELSEPPRRASGYRQYSEQVVTRLRFIQRAKLLGFSLKEITELLRLRVDAQTSCDEVKHRTEAKLAEVERKMVELQRMRHALLQVASLCIGPGPTSACPMLDALDQQEPQDPGGTTSGVSNVDGVTTTPRCSGDARRLAGRVLDISKHTCAWKERK